MQYSLNLLKKYINVDMDIEKLSFDLTVKTCEIEEIIKRQIPADVVIAKVTSVEKHPDADKLNVCQVDCGNKWKFQIVTWADNIKADILVPVSLPGCYLPAIDLKIEPRKMRGLDSNWMICSKEELWINEDKELHGIWILKELERWKVKGESEEDFWDDISEEDIGKSLVSKFPWLENYILDVDNKTLTNRPDLTGHFGLAIDLNWIYGEAWVIKFNKVSEYLKGFKDTNILDLLQSSNKGSIQVESQTKDLFTYIALELNNVEIKKSDFFSRLLLIDQWSAPRNNWVDFSNLFMNLSGQPVHFFDKAKIDGKIIVRNAKDWEQFTDLFDKTHTLKSTDIVISDNLKVLALAWVVGGKESGVTESTKDIIVEIANFDSVSVRKTWTRLALRTDAETRYEKNINPLFSLYALILFLDELKLFSKTLWNYIIWGLNYYISDETAKALANPKTISINFDDMENFIFGDKVAWFHDKALKILENIGFENTNWWLLVPVWRSPDDMNIKEDIYEEVSRIYGYDNIWYKNIEWKVENVPYSMDVFVNRTVEETLVERMWFDQVETYPFVDEFLLDAFQVDKSNLFKLQNPITPEWAHMRDDMIYNLLGFVSKNFRFYDNINIFDIGKVWDKRNWDLNNPSTPAQTWETTMLGFVSYQKSIKNWQDDNVLFLKWVVAELLHWLNLKWKIEYFPTSDSRFHPKKQWEIMFNRKSIWTIKVLHPVYFETFDLPEKCQVCYVQINLDAIKQIISEKKISMWLAQYETLQDQIIYRDLSFVLDRSENFGKVADAVAKVRWVESVEVFDIYAWENLPADKKSIAVKFKIIWDGKMTTEQINEIMNNAIAEVEKVWWKLR